MTNNNNNSLIDNGADWLIPSVAVTPLVTDSGALPADSTTFPGTAGSGLLGGAGWADQSVLPALIDMLVNAHYAGSSFAVGENATLASGGKLFWRYDPNHGLFLDALPGYLTTASGNGGFSLHVGLDGTWTLSFSGENGSIGSSGGSANPRPPLGDTIVFATNNGPTVYDATAGDIIFDGYGSPYNPVVGNDTVSGGVGDVMIGGSAPHTESLAGNVGNCAIYTGSPGPVLVDMQNGHGYGANAEGNVLINMNQVRGSLYSDVLIGSSSGTDLKSGGADSILISTGGNGYELRPDGPNDVLLSTVGADLVLFDPAHGWALGDSETMLGFNPAHNVVLDLTLIGSDFYSPEAAGYNPVTGTGNIDDYVSIVDATDGSHIMFSPDGQVQAGGTQLINLKLVHGLNVDALYSHGNIQL